MKYLTTAASTCWVMMLFSLMISCQTPEAQAQIESPTTSTGPSPISNGSKAATAGTKVEPTPPTAPAPRILILGDSHATGGFGIRLHDNLAKLKRYDVYSFALCAATFASFYQKSPRTHCGHIERRSDAKSSQVSYVVNKPYPNHSRAQGLDHHITAFQPTVVIAELGMNMATLSQNNLANQVVEFVQYLAARQVQQFILIGPPTYFQAEHIESGFKSGIALAPFGNYISSLAFNRHKPMNPKILHLPQAAALKWGDYAFEKLLPLLPSAGSR